MSIWFYIALIIGILWLIDREFFVNPKRRRKKLDELSNVVYKSAVAQYGNGILEGA